MSKFEPTPEFRVLVDNPPTYPVFRSGEGDPDVLQQKWVNKETGKTKWKLIKRIDKNRK